MTSITLRTRRLTDDAAIIDLWNVHVGSDHPLRAATLHHAMQAAYKPDWCLVAEDAGDIVGFIWAKAALWGKDHHARAHVCAIATHPDKGNQGIGTTLWQELMTCLRAAGVRHVRLGGAAHQLLPGIPHGVNLATWRFLRANGVVFQGLEHDLHADLTQLPALRLPEHYRVLPVTQDDTLADAAVDFVGKAFAGRWHDEVRERLAAGETVLVLEHTPNKTMIGFAYVTFNSHYPAPNLNWRASLPTDKHVAGLGPIGIDATMRGQGLGLTFLHACCQYLREQGATDVLIDWTDLVAFYARIGGHVWRTYQRGYVVLE